jgi:hypothetical protein
MFAHIGRGNSGNGARAIIRISPLARAALDAR